MKTIDEMAREVASKKLTNGPTFVSYTDIKLGILAGLRMAAEVCEAEALAYDESMKRCDDSGNTAGGTHDAIGAGASRRIRDAILALKGGE